MTADALLMLVAGWFLAAAVAGLVLGRGIAVMRGRDAEDVDVEAPLDAVAALPLPRDSPDGAVDATDGQLSMFELR